MKRWTFADAVAAVRGRAPVALLCIGCAGALWAADGGCRELAREWNVRAFGAVGDGRADDTVAIQRTIDACASSERGGRVVVPKGMYLSYTLSLKSNVELHLQDGATLLGGTEGEKYAPFAPTDVWRPERSPRFNRRAFLYTPGATNVAITGSGAIDGNAAAFHAWSEEECRWKRISDTKLTGRCVFFVGCRNVRVEGVTIRNSTGWATWFLDCDDLVIRDLVIRCDRRFLNSDGIHLGGCRDVVVTGCDVDSEDDALILRAHQEQMRVPHALERVLVSNCVFRAARPCGIRLGWSGDAPLRDILVTHCVIPHSGTGIGCWVPPMNRFLNTDPPRWNGTDFADHLDKPGGMLPFALENVRFENLEVHAVRTPFQFDVFNIDTYHGDNALELTPVSTWKDVVLKNCRFYSDGMPVMSRPPDMKISGWRFENVELLPARTAERN